jgi:hypothetical protein
MYIEITEIRSDGSSEVILSGNDDGTGDCIERSVPSSAGTVQLRLDGYSDNQVIATAETYFQVMSVGGGVFLAGTFPNGREIMFLVDDFNFRSLKIVGKNQDGKETTWIDPQPFAKRITITQGYRWKETVVISFYVVDIGWRGCVIDNLKQPAQVDRIDIIYYEGDGCYGGTEEDRARALIPESAVRDYAEYSRPTAPLSCFRDLVVGLAKPWSYVKVAQHCVVSPGIWMIQAIANAYGRVVQTRSR